MTSAIVGQICCSARNRAGLPGLRGWLPCDGAAYLIKDYELLHGVIGDHFGGDGERFNVPDMRGVACVGVGNAPGLLAYELGQTGGFPSHTMTVQTMPTHNHTLDFDNPPGIHVQASTENATSDVPLADGYLAAGNFKKGLSTTLVSAYREFPSPEHLLQLHSLYGKATGTIEPAGAVSPQPMENRQAFMPFGFFIKL